MTFPNTSPIIIHHMFRGTKIILKMHHTTHRVPPFLFTYHNRIIQTRNTLKKNTLLKARIQGMKTTQKKTSYNIHGWSLITPSIRVYRYPYGPDRCPGRLQCHIRCLGIPARICYWTYRHESTERRVIRWKRGLLWMLPELSVSSLCDRLVLSPCTPTCKSLCFVNGEKTISSSKILPPI